MGFLHIDHVGIVAYTIEQAQEVLGDALGLELDVPRSQWPTGIYFPRADLQLLLPGRRRRDPGRGARPRRRCDLRYRSPARPAWAGTAPHLLRL